MGELFIGVVVVYLLLIAVYIAGKKKDSFVRYFSRSAYMRELNNKMEEK
jgi:hypothetical protein